MTSPQEERISLYCKNASSDKEYHLQLVAEGDAFMVYYQNGPRGGTLTSGKKTPSPVAYAVAKKKYDSVVKEKLKGGYSPGEAGAAFVGTDLEERITGLVPQLLNSITEERAQELILDRNWVMQQKYDGQRRMAAVREGLPLGANRRGLSVPLVADVASALSVIFENGPLEVGGKGNPVFGAGVPLVEALASNRATGFFSDGSFEIDGEQMGDTLVLFDVLMLDSVDLRAKPYRERLAKMDEIATRLDAAGAKGIVVLQTAVTTEEKRALYDRLKEEGQEGVVFKRLDAPYEPGRPSSGGNQLKFKFMHQASCLVASIHPTKRSIGLSLWNAEGDAVDVGNCQIPTNYDIPAVGQVVEIKYLYAFLGGKLFQPQYQGKRDDVISGECLMTQLHYKPATADSDEDES